MSLQFNNIGYLNFNKDYDKKFENGSITCSMTVSKKNADGDFETGYMSAIVPGKKVTSLIKKALNASASKKKNDSVLLNISGIITMNGKYANATIFEVSKYEKEDDDNVPF